MFRSLRARLWTMLPALAATPLFVGVWGGVFWGACASVVCGIVIAELIARSIVPPLEEIRRCVNAVAEGDLSKRVRSKGNDELGTLGRAVDDMAERLTIRLDAVRSEEARLRTILDAMVEAVLVTDAEGRIVLTNAALSQLAGGNVVGRTVVEAIRNPELHDAAVQALHGTAGSVQVDRHFAGRRRVLAAQVAPLPSRAGVVAVLHDVTDLKRADEVRRDFVANASHELRTPLTAIRGFAETLRDGALDDSALAGRFVQTILENSMRLQRLVDDLLELSRAESPEARVSLSTVDATATVAKVLRSLAPQASQKNIVLEFAEADRPWPVVADERALDQVLVNLVDNAIKYTPPRGEVRIRLTRGAERTVIEVADTGPGIPAASLSRIFERFYRVDAGRARRSGGTGLGLAIAKHLVQRMNGELSVESSIGKGSTFRVSLVHPEERLA